MATLINKQTQEKVTLRVNHTFGRDAETNITILQSPSASRNHAIICWDGKEWRLRDTSSNGSFINQVRSNQGVFNPLKDKAKIRFGHLPSETWEVLDLTPPVTCLIPLHESLPLIPLYDTELLPLDNVEIMVYLAEGGQWFCDAGEGGNILTSGDKVGHDGLFWQFSEARTSDITATESTAPPPDDIQFHFQVSQSEEHVSLNLVVDNRVIDFGERSHHYLLLLMARQRLEDQAKGLDVAEQGWIKKDVLIKMLGMEEQHINIHICRFRKQVANNLPQPAFLHQVIERRLGELRFAYSRIQIIGGLQRGRYPGLAS